MTLDEPLDYSEALPAHHLSRLQGLSLGSIIVIANTIGEWGISIEAACAYA